MRRHGWAFCLGAILAGSAAAQPPAGEERYPPAPDLPGTVVSQPPAPRPADGPKDTPKAESLKADTPKPAEPRDAAPPADVTVMPNGTKAAPVIPVEPAPIPAMGMFAPADPACCPPARSGCHIGYSEIKQWLCFRSQARDSGKYVTPYRPPLYAWFPCEPRPLAAVAAPACAGCAAKAPAAAPAPLATEVLDGEQVPTGTDVPEPPLGGGVPIGKCHEAEVLTTFQPVNPGLLFAPGAAPMANPTTQVKPTSFKPK
jgi:hypothetical protein